MSFGFKIDQLFNHPTPKSNTDRALVFLLHFALHNWQFKTGRGIVTRVKPYSTINISIHRVPV